MNVFIYFIDEYLSKREIKRLCRLLMKEKDGTKREEIIMQVEYCKLFTYSNYKKFLRRI